jgi:hypothetical protein
MVKRLRFQENRKIRHRRDRTPRGAWVLEPMDMAMAAVAVAALLWLAVLFPA